MRRIGVGGMGEVFYAFAYGVARSRKPVVVKVLRPEMLSEPGAAEMFVEEGRLSLQLSHSNILQVFDFGKADDRFFMAMEYVDGLHLGELRKRAGGKLPPDQAAFIAMEVTLGLDYAHRLKDDRGVPLHIVHRDVTPSNVLISREGEVKLADFGIARAVGRSQHTQAGQIRGKVRYMSPEAARGEPLDHRADLFSVGAVLFELLTGRKAFDAKGREAILQQIVSSNAPRPSDTGEDVHGAIDEVVAKALAPKREDRFVDAFAMHRAIEEACREAGLRPSRGSFLEFIRALEAADAAEEANSWRSGTDDAREPDLAAVPGSLSSVITPSRRTPATAPPDEMSRVKTVAIQDARDVQDLEEGRPTPAAIPHWPVETTVGVAPPGRDSRPSKPSSTEGTVPLQAGLASPEGTALPTGVASPVLFTLTVAEQERTPSIGSLPRFEVTKFDAPPPPDRTTDKPLYDADLAVPIEEAPENAPTARKPRPGGARADRPSSPTMPALDSPPDMETVIAERETVVPAPPEEPEAPEDPEEPEAPVDPDSLSDAPNWRVRRGAGPARREERDRDGVVDYPIPAPPDPDRRRALFFLAVGGAVVVLIAIVFAMRDRDGGGIAIRTPAPVRTRAPATPASTPTRVVLAVTPAPTPTQTPPLATHAMTATPRPTPFRTPAPRASIARATVTPPPVAAFGVVDINSDPWSEVRANGKLLGNTPQRRVRLPVGKVELVFRTKTGVVKSMTVDVRSGENPAVLVQLSP